MSEPSGAATPGWLRDLDGDVVDRVVGRLSTLGPSDGAVLIAAHVSPDGDALGAALALHHALSARGARTFPTVGEQPLRVPAPLTVLPGIGDLVDDEGLPPADEVSLLITVDAAARDRLGSVARYLDTGVTSVVLDHHARGTVFGDLRLVAPRASATVEVVAHLLDRIGAPLDLDVATCLYAGLVTDTGRFGYASTDASSHLLAARLLAAGVDHAGLTRRLFDTRSIGQLRLLGRALDRLEFVPDVALVHTHVTHAELDATGSGADANESVIDLLRSADIAEVALVVKPSDHGTWRASLRSRGTVDVGAVAAALGGGGHTLAAGFSFSGDVEHVIASVVDRLRAG